MKSGTSEKRVLAPILRFPEFIDIGAWEERAFREVVSRSFYGTSSSTSDSGTYPVLRMGNMLNGALDIRNLTYIDLSEEQFERFELKCGDILLNRTNSVDLVGKISLFELEGKYVAASYLVAFRLDTTLITPKFCNYILNSHAYQRRIRNLATRAISQANINPTTFQEELTISVPSLPEQQRIASCLSSIDELIAAAVKKLDALNDYKAGLLRQFFPAKNETQPKLRFPEFRDEWEETRLSAITDSISSGSDERDPDGAYTLYGSTGVIGKT